MLRALLVLSVAFVWPVPMFGQATAMTVKTTSFRGVPGGTRLATVVEAVVLPVGDASDGWREATLEGWVWAPSLRETSRDGHDLVVDAPSGENLRAAPSGERVARLVRGVLLHELARRGDWVRVRRRGWIRASALDPTARATAAVPEPAEPPTDSPPTDRAPDRAEWIRAGTGTVLVGSPDGDTVATLRPGTAARVVERAGNWVRVRLEAWAWEPGFSAAVDSAAVLDEVSAAMLAARPERYRGRIVEWTVQFIALEFADEVRSEFYAGEPFMLARGPGGDAGFVYIAVAPELVDAVERLTPLERVTVLARVRTGRAELTGAPVLELLELRSRE